MAKAKVKFYEREDGEWAWTLLGGNGEVVSHGEGHATRSDAKRAFERNVALAAEAWTEEITEDGSDAA